MKAKSSLSYSALFLICCLCLGLGGCSAKRANLDHEALLRAEVLTARYGTAETPLSRAYLDYLQRRLCAALDGYLRRNEQRTRLALTILNTQEPVAVSPGNGIIHLSRGLILGLQNETELAFVLAHEIAHLELGHFDETGSGTHASSRRELESDKFALGLVALAGYDIRLVPAAIYHAYALNPETDSQFHPPPEARVQAVQTAINESPWTPPGSQDRRAFHELKAELGDL